MKSASFIAAYQSLAIITPNPDQVKVLLGTDI